MTAATPTRTPHPVQASPGLAAAWIARQALGVGSDALVVLAIPVLGSIFAGSPDDQGRLTDVALLIVAAVVAMTIARSVIARFIRMRVPGGLLGAPGSARFPDDIAVAVRGVALIVVAVAAAQLASPDKNFTPVALSGLGGALLALSAITVAMNVSADPKDWARIVAHSALAHALPGAFALAAGTTVAPGDNAPTVTAATAGVMGFLAVEAIVTAFRWARVRETVHGAADMAAGALMSQVHPAPTVTDQARVSLWVRVGLYGAVAASLVVLLFV